MHEWISFLTKVWRGSLQNCRTRVWKVAGNIITPIAVSMFMTAGASADPGWVQVTQYFYPGGSCKVYDDGSGGKIIIGQGKLLDLNKLDAAVGGGFQDLGVGTAYAITADASTVVGQANYATAFLWNQASGMQDLGSLPGYSNSVGHGGQR